MIGGDCCQISLRTLNCFSFFRSTPVAPTASTSDANVAISSSTINNKDCSSGHDNQMSSVGHEPFHCNITNMYLTKESIFHLKCKMCGLEQTLETDVLDRSTKDMDVNLATTLAAVSTGIVAEVICKTGLQTIEEAGKEEAALAIASGDVDEEGIPLLTVVTDGAWCKRSYNVNYDAASGV
ncbi:hypothetical protein ILUMI_14283, partial [Ignelater luminosus]